MKESKPKRQATFKLIVKNTKKSGLNIQLSSYSGASELQTEEERAVYISEEKFILENGKPLFMNDVRKAISDALSKLINDKGVVYDYTNMVFINED